jgi:hypothetical protein
MDGNQSVAGRIGSRPFAAWISRSLGAMAADLESVECGSLDVLLYCADDLDVSARGDSEIDRSLRSTPPRLGGRHLSII